MMQKRNERHGLPFAVIEPLIIFFLFPLLLLTPCIVFSQPEQETKPVILELGHGAFVPNVDVYCNDVHLGKTPLSIPWREIQDKVPPREYPPRQEFVEEDESWEPDRNHPLEYHLEKLVKSPLMIEQEANNIPYYGESDGEMDYYNMKIAEYLSQSKYWWRMERNGCMALLPTHGGGHSVTGDGSILTFTPDVLMTFPSNKPHVHMLLAALQEKNNAPTEKWLNHVWAYCDLLFYDFYVLAKNDSRLKSTLQAAVIAGYGIHDKMKQADYRRVVQTIMDRVEKQDGFRYPSPESMALDIIMENIGEIAAEEYKKLLSQDVSLTGRGYRRRSNHYLFYREGKANRFIPLEYAIQRTMPPSIYDQLVSEYQKLQHRPYMSHLAQMIGNYQRPETKRIFDTIFAMLRSDEPDSNLRIRRGRKIREREKLHRIAGFINNVAAKIANPDLEDRFRDLVEEFSDSRGIHRYNWFVESRLNNPAFDQNELMKWIIEESAYDVGMKSKYLLQIRAEEAYAQFKTLRKKSHKISDVDIVSALLRHPNPYMDQALIDVYENYLARDNNRIRHGRMIEAMVKCNTPKMIEYLHAMWHNHPQERGDILEALGALYAGHPVLNQWLDILPHLEEPIRQKQALPVLVKTSSPVATTVIQVCAKSSEEEVRTAAQNALKEIKQRKQNIEKLLEGEIQPDDLLPPSPVYVWKDGDYARENE